MGDAEVVGRGVLAKPVSVLDKVTVSWLVAGLVNDFSEEEVEDYRPVADGNNMR